MAKKNLLDSAVRYEINCNIDETIEVLEKLGFIKLGPLFYDSHAYNWFDDEPSEEDKKAFLEKMGYEL